MERKVRRVITGVRWKSLHEANYFTSRFFKELVIDACIYTILLLIPVFLLVGLAFHAQLIYSVTTGVALPSSVVDTENIGNLKIQDEDKYYFPSYILIVGTLILVLMVGSRILLQYVGIGKTAIYCIYAKICAWAITLALFGCSTLVSMVGLWILVGTILDPSKNLVSGTALIVVLVVLYRTANSLISYRYKISNRVSVTIDGILQERLQAKFTELRESQKDKSTRSALKPYEEQDDEVTISDLFDLLDTTEDVDDSQTRSLDFSEFSSMFDYLGFSISEHTKQMMFGFADRDNKGELGLGDFAEAWEYLKTSINMVVADRIGLSDGDILLCVLYAIAIFALTLPFLFTAIQLWDNQGTFETVIYTIFVGTTGAFANVRSQGARDQANDDSYLQGVIKTAIKSLK